MQKERNVQIIRKSIVVLAIVFTSFCGLAQKKEIKSKDDYLILNKTLEIHFAAKKKEDSLFFKDASRFLKDSVQRRKIESYIKRRKKQDTLYIKIIADKVLYKQFLRKNANWRKQKYTKKYLAKLNSIFTEKEITNFNKQLKSNCYLWDKLKIRFKNSVFINKEFSLTKDEIKKLSKEQNKIEQEKIASLERKLNLYTFSKPIYSLHKKYALIAYNRVGTNILHIFKKVNNGWVLEFTLNNNMFISKVIP